MKNLLCLNDGFWLDDECLENFCVHLGYRNRLANAGKSTAYFFTVAFMTCLMGNPDEGDHGE